MHVAKIWYRHGVTWEAITHESSYNKHSRRFVLTPRVNVSAGLSYDTNQPVRQNGFLQPAIADSMHIGDEHTSEDDAVVSNIIIL